jgi:hypothetical protein
MDKEIRAHLDAIEARLMARMNDAQEVIIERVRSCETSIRACETAIHALTEVARSGNTTMSMIAGMMVDVGRRVTDLEKKG